jgi:hypothetical protein
MVQIIPENRKKTTEEKWVRGLQAAMPGIQNMLQKFSQDKGAQGLGLDPNLSPEMQKMQMQYKLMEGFEKQKGKNRLDELEYKNQNRQNLFDQIEGRSSKSNSLSGQVDDNFDEIMQTIDNVEQQTGYQFTPEEKRDLFDKYHEKLSDNDNETPNLKKAKLYAAAGEHDLSQVAKEEEKLRLKGLESKNKLLSDSFKSNRPYIDKTYDQYEDYLRKDAIFERMDQLEDEGELSESGIVNLLDQLGLKQEWIQNPANEEYNKLSLDLLGGGSLQADYGSRIFASEFKVSQQRIPSLSQTAEGRKQIKENLRTMLLPSKLKHERMQYYIDKAERTGKPLPHDLRGKVLRDIKPQLEEAYDKFKQRNGRYKVQEGTYPDDNSIEKYYFLSNGNEKKALNMMREDGYDVK